MTLDISTTGEPGTPHEPRLPPVPAPVALLAILIDHLKTSLGLTFLAHGLPLLTLKELEYVFDVKSADRCFSRLSLEVKEAEKSDTETITLELSVKRGPPPCFPL